MKIFAKVKPNSKKDEIKKLDDTHFEIRVTAQAREGKANAAAIKALSNYLGIPPSRIKIHTGAKSKQKIFEVS